MIYTGSIRFYRIRGGPNGWQETMICTLTDHHTPLTWEELQTWFAARMADHTESDGWRVLGQEVKTI